MPNYMEETVSSEAKRTAKYEPAGAEHPPWIPAGAGTRSLDGQASTPGTTHNIVAQRQAESREARLADVGSMESTVFDGRPRSGTNFKGIESGDAGQPQFAPAESRKGTQRAYVSLDAPGMGSGAEDTRMNRHEVSAQYRQSYVGQQQDKGRNTEAIPATFHAEVSLSKARSIEQHAIPQQGATSVPGYKDLDQVSDGHKYKSSFGLAPASLEALSATIRPGSERIATASHAGRQELAQHYSPGSVVHPSELRTPSEQIEQRREAAKMAPVGNVGRRG